MPQTPKPTSDYWRPTATRKPIDGTKFPTLAYKHTKQAQALTETAQAPTPTPEATPTTGPKGYTKQWGWSEISCPLGGCSRNMLGNIVYIEDRENLVATMWVYSADMVNNYLYAIGDSGIHLNGSSIKYSLNNDPPGKGSVKESGCRIVYQVKDRNAPVKAYIDELAATNGCTVVQAMDGKPEAVPQYFQAFFTTTGAENQFSVNNKYMAVGIYWGVEPEEETPTPGPSVCDAVQGEDDTGGQSPAWITMPQIMIRPGSCTQIGGWTISLGWVSNVAEAAGIEVPEAIQIFGLNVCFTEINFGEIGILGIKINLDLLAAVAAGVALIRIFR